MVQATRNAVWDWDLTTNRVAWGEGLESLLGHAPAGPKRTVRRSLTLSTKYCVPCTEIDCMCSAASIRLGRLGTGSGAGRK